MADVTLTPRQREILEVIEQHQRDRGFPPSVREIGEAVGLTSPSTVHAHLATLEKLGGDKVKQPGKTHQLRPQPHDGNTITPGRVGRGGLSHQGYFPGGGPGPRTPVPAAGARQRHSRPAEPGLAGRVRTPSFKGCPRARPRVRPRFVHRRGRQMTYASSPIDYCWSHV